MSVKDRPPVEYLRQCFEYRDGKIFWLVRPREHFTSDKSWKRWNTRYSKREAGSCGSYNSGLRWITKLSRYGMVLRNQIVWAMHNGRWPELWVDHKNRNSLDDSIENLRLSTPSQNHANKSVQSTNVSGYKGVSQKRRVKATRWTAQICVRGKIIHIGTFDTPQEAHAAYFEAARKHFGEFASDGTR